MIDKVTEDVFVELVQAAVNNRYIREYHRSERYGHLWTTENIMRHPPMRVHFENAMVIGTIGEAIDIRKSKSNWGNFIGIEPISPDDMLDPERIVYSLKATSKMRMRWEFRDTFKSILGRDRGLVNDAVRESKRDFTKSLTPEQQSTIWYKLHLTLADFWVHCRYGERFGPNAIHAFAELLRERTHGYKLPFDVPLENLK